MSKTTPGGGEGKSRRTSSVQISSTACDGETEVEGDGEIVLKAGK